MLTVCTLYQACVQLRRHLLCLVPTLQGVPLADADDAIVFTTTVDGRPTGTLSSTSPGYRDKRELFVLYNCLWVCWRTALLRAAGAVIVVTVITVTSCGSAGSSVCTSIWLWLCQACCTSRQHAPIWLAGQHWGCCYSILCLLSGWSITVGCTQHTYINMLLLLLLLCSRHCLQASVTSSWLTGPRRAQP